MIDPDTLGGGIELSETSNHIIINNILLNHYNGIYLSSSNYNYIVNNSISSCNKSGISLGYSYWNEISFNRIFLNNQSGIYFYSSHDNNITSNNVSNNDYGLYFEHLSHSNNICYNSLWNNNIFNVYLDDSGNNDIFHNNFISSSNQAYDIVLGSNHWDNGYPSGGNYWSDYIGVDNNKGPDQDIPGSDGIGDTNYSIDSDSIDHYPLMDPYPNFYIFLENGWNLISIPWIQSEKYIDSCLQEIQGEYDCLEWYNTTDMNDHWKVNHTSKPASLNDLDDLNNKMGFWVHITNPNGTVFIFNGTQPTENQTITLYPGWNLVGYPSLTNKMRNDALNNISFGTQIDSIWTYDAFSQGWKELDEFDFFEIGKGYWIHAKTKCVWEVPL
jgi:parallel beta-helix repeat protein